MMLAKVRKMDTEGLKSKSPKYPYISGLEDAVIDGYTESKHKTYKRRHWHVSPELVSGMSKPSTASDIYSLGRVIKHNRPFHFRARSMAYTSAEKYVPFRVSA